jgi:hypothetical protein
MSGRLKWCSTAIFLAACPLLLSQTMLTQAEQEDPGALLRQRRQAPAPLRQEAQSWLKDAEAAAKEGRWDLATKAYGESAGRFPTFKALKGYGDATGRGDRKRDSLEETLKAQRAAFESALRRLKAAVAFAEQGGERVPGAELTAVREQISCLEGYLKTSNASCEPVKSVLQRYSVKRAK